MYGNHRDAWVYGAVDPSSGTACMMEIVRIYGEMMSEGWRPRRSVLEQVDGMRNQVSGKLSKTIHASKSWAFETISKIPCSCYWLFH